MHMVNHGATRSLRQKQSCRDASSTVLDLRSSGYDDDAALVDTVTGANELWPAIHERLAWIHEVAAPMRSLAETPDESPTALTAGSDLGVAPSPLEKRHALAPPAMKRFVLLVETKNESEISFLHVGVIDKKQNGCGTLMEFVLTTQHGKIKLLKLPNAQKEVFTSGSAIQHRTNRSRILFFFAAPADTPIEGHIKFRVLSSNGSTIESEPVPVGQASSASPASSVAASPASPAPAKASSGAATALEPVPAEAKQQDESELHRSGLKRSRSSDIKSVRRNVDSPQDQGADDNEVGVQQQLKRVRSSKIKDFFRRIDDTTKDFIRLGKQIFDSQEFYF